MTSSLRNHADSIARRTMDAYSFNYYGFASWRMCCAFLISRGYSDTEVETVLRSKLMRYTADDRKHARATSADLARTFNKPWVPEYLVELFAEANTPEPIPSRQALRLVWSR